MGTWQAELSLRINEYRRVPIIMIIIIISYYDCLSLLLLPWMISYLCIMIIMIIIIIIIMIRSPSPNDSYYYYYYNYYSW